MASCSSVAVPRTAGIDAERTLTFDSAYSGFAPISVVGRRQREVSQSTEKWPFPISPVEARARGTEVRPCRRSPGGTASRQRGEPLLSGDCLISDADDP